MVSGSRRTAGAVFQVDSCGVGRVADRVVPAGEHEHVECLLIGEVGVKSLPQCIVDVCAVVEGVSRFDQHLVSVIDPAGVGRSTMGDGCDLVAREAGSLGEEGDVDALFLFRIGI